MTGEGYFDKSLCKNFTSICLVYPRSGKSKARTINYKDI